MGKNKEECVNFYLCRGGHLRAHHTRNASQQLLRVHVPATVPALAILVLDSAHEDGPFCTRLSSVELEVYENVRRRKRTARPDNAQSGEGEREKDELGLDIRVRNDGVLGLARFGVDVGACMEGFLDVDDGLRGRANLECVKRKEQKETWARTLREKDLFCSNSMSKIGCL